VYLYVSMLVVCDCHSSHLGGLRERAGWREVFPQHPSGVGTVSLIPGSLSFDGCVRGRSSQKLHGAQRGAGPASQRVLIILLETSSFKKGG
jgi:hypothetical protein